MRHARPFGANRSWRLCQLVLKVASGHRDLVSSSQALGGLERARHPVCIAQCAPSAANGPGSEGGLFGHVRGRPLEDFWKSAGVPSWIPRSQPRGGGGRDTWLVCPTKDHRWACMVVAWRNAWWREGSYTASDMARHGPFRSCRFLGKRPRGDDCRGTSIKRAKSLGKQRPSTSTLGQVRKCARQQSAPQNEWS